MIENLSEIEKAYIAGIIDGEGSISFVRSGSKRTHGRYIYPYIRVANTDIILIDWLKLKIECGYSGYKNWPKKDKRKPVYHISWACSDAIKILKEITPYLVIKKIRAELVMGIYEKSKQARKEAGGYFGNGHKLPDWLVQERERVFSQLKEMNARGVCNSTN